jgi:hypothetical protein
LAVSLVASGALVGAEGLIVALAGFGASGFALAEARVDHPAVLIFGLPRSCFEDVLPLVQCIQAVLATGSPSRPGGAGNDGSVWPMVDGDGVSLSEQLFEGGQGPIPGGFAIGDGTTTQRTWRRGRRVEDNIVKHERALHGLRQ